MDTDDMRMYKSKTNGRMSGSASDEIISGVVQNLLPHITSSQRAAGHFDYYKTWWHLADDADATGVDPEMYYDYPTLSDDDYVMLFAIGERVAITDITGYATGADSETKYGGGYLTTSITAGDASFDVTLKNVALSTGADLVFRAGGTIKITDKTIDTSTSGNEETHTISGTPTVSSDGLTVTITVADSAGIANSYTADGTKVRVRSIYVPGTDFETTVTSVVLSDSSSDYDETNYPILLDNIGTVDEDWTITFTDAANFRLDGDSLGTSVATGSTATDFAPNNSDKTKPYFTMYAAGFSGFTAGDTITFTTKPSAKGYGIKRVIPAASGSLANNKVSNVLVLEAAPA